MAGRWQGFDLKQVQDPALRNQLKRLDVWAKQLSQDVKQVVTSTTITTGGLVAHASSHLPGASDALTTAAPVAIGTANSAGTAASFVRSDHVHSHGTFASGDYHTEYLLADGTRDLTGTLNTTVGTFTSDVASGGIAFDLDTNNTFSSGTLFAVSNNTTGLMDLDFAGHCRIGSLGGVQSQQILYVAEALSADNRTSYAGIRLAPTISGAIPGVIYSPVLQGLVASLTFSPSAFPSIGTRTLEGGRFSVQYSPTDATHTVQTVRGGFFSVADSSSSSPLSVAVLGDFTLSGSFSGGLTQAYGIRQNALSAGTTKWGGYFGNRVAIDSPAADAQNVLELTQSNTGATDGVHINMDDKAGEPTNTSTGDIWWNGDLLYTKASTGVRQSLRYAMMMAN